MPTDEHPDVPLTTTTERPADGVAVIRPDGDVDTATTGGVRAVIEQEVAAGAQHVVLDLSGVAFMGSSGLALLVEQREAAISRGGSLHLAAAPRSVTRPLSLTGLAEHFDSHESLDGAIEAAVGTAGARGSGAHG